MDENEQDALVLEVRRELIRLATGILMERYGVANATAESALMDWSRISERDVHDLAARLVADAQQAVRRSTGE